MNLVPILQNPIAEHLFVTQVFTSVISSGWSWRQQTSLTTALLLKTVTDRSEVDYAASQGCMALAFLVHTTKKTP